jgi:hypothetical protein
MFTLQVGPTLIREYSLYFTKAPQRADYEPTIHLFEVNDGRVVAVAKDNEATQLGRYGSFLGGSAVPMREYMMETRSNADARWLEESNELEESAEQRACEIIWKRISPEETQ